MQDSKRDTDKKNRLLDSVGEGKGGMIWENSTETCILPYVKQITSPSSMHQTGHSKPVHWDNPEGWNGEGGGRGVQDGGHMYTHGWFMSMYGKTTTVFKVIQFSCSVMSDSLRPHEPQLARPPCPSPTPGIHPNPCPLSQWCHPTISSSVVPPSLPALNLSQHQGLLKWVSPSHQVAKVLEFQLQHQSFQLK